VLIEQAIFTSAKTSRGAGYQLVARSPGVTEDEARALTSWGPSHGALCEERDEGSSVNFHRLESGKFAISKTVAAGQEFSGRGGARIYTQYFLVLADVLAKFANNPFAILRAAWAKGLLTVHDEMPKSLEAFSLAGRTPTVDEGLLGQLADQWGAQTVGRLVASAMAAGQKVIAGAKNNETLIGGLLNCFPVECRSELSFTTGLRHSPRRPFRLSPADTDAAAQRRIARQGEIELIDLHVTDALGIALTGWAHFVSEAIAADQLPMLSTQLQVLRPGLTMDRLNALGEELFGNLHVTATSSSAGSERRTSRSDSEQEGTRLFRHDGPNRSYDVRNEPADSTRRVGRRKSDRTAYESRPKFHATDHPEVVELFEQLDDAVFDAVSGSPHAEENVLKLWHKISAHLNADQLSSTREQYLRYTLTLWDACANEGVRDAEKAIRALEVLTVVFGN
jgi:hypothetical protein